MTRIGEGYLFISAGSKICPALIKGVNKDRMNSLFLFLFLFLFSGCAQVKQLQNLDPLLTLKGYSDEKEAQEKWVVQEAGKFDSLVAAVQDKSAEHFSSQEAFLRRFGEPVLIEHLNEEGMLIERWLYRHPIQKLATDRVYIFFDQNGQLLRCEHAVPSAHDRS